MNGTRPCPRCGFPAAEADAFCAACGLPQTAGPAPQPQPFAYAQPGYPGAYAPAPHWGRALIALSIVFFVSAATAVALTFALAPFAADPYELTGAWSASFTLTQTFGEDIKSRYIGETQNAVMFISLIGDDSDGSGLIKMEDMTFSANYERGRLAAASMIEDDLEFSFEGALQKTEGSFEFSGTWKFTSVRGAERGESARGTWAASLPR